MQLNKQIREEISRQINSKSFHKTELYKLLRDELSGIGNWKAKPRGKPDVNNFTGKQKDEWLRHKNIAINYRTLEGSGSCVQFYD